MIDQLRHETAHLRHKLAHPGHLAGQLRHWLAEPDVRLGFSLVGGTAVWVLYFSAVNALNSLACRWGWLGAPADSSGLKLVQLTATVLALALITLAGLNAYTIWRATRRQASADAGEPGNPLQPGQLEQTVAARTPFLAFVILLLNVLYLLIILITLAPIAMLATCGV